MRRARIGAAVRYFLSLFLLLFLYFATGSSYAAGLGFFLLLLPPVSMAVNFYVRRKIRVKLSLPTTAAKGTACMGSVHFENNGWLPAFQLHCRIRIVNDLTREETSVELTSGLGPRQRARRDYLMESVYCGRIYCSLESVRILDYLGLFSLKIPVKAGARLTVLPELFSCDVVASSVSAVSDESTVSRRGDDRTEVFQLREYQSGDDIRQIHWKLSTKLDTLLVKEPSQSVSRSLLVFWDKRPGCSPRSMDAMAEVAASVCQGLCDSGTAFDLCWTEKEELELRQIRDGDALLTTIPALVTQAGSGECQDPELSEYGQVLYITAAIPLETGSDEITYLICSEEEYHDGRSIVFSPENYTEQLERLEF